ncbi:flagellar hook-associated protein 3 [Thermoanaerobacter mathranii subsp. mathranii str. A3]|uniref:Flagellar hook-associated protein 3 n=1 Tax=Thermoanaerobacter mathranii subsp. mathranii (strain DSM 11426 / CCUG 53645 / CIP 108742 / A3) TaxID=583358 RepID=A0ABM5LNG3_THEM3|nr:flagellar hook-associated protein FlgL [Thermoanaerobacter mathranii]ADH60317.1 flagellar hook-associated protein 3 [Thermoanaerobacter mathranii subsp. mathranii str. A3]
MRVTDGMLITNFLNNYHNNLEKLQKNQNMLSTGKKISRPSDDPVAVATSLRIRTDIARNDAYTKNADEVQSWLDMTDTALGQLGDLLQRTRELAVEGANGTLTQADMQKIAEEIEQLKAQMIQVGNTQYNGRYIFAGFKTTTQPFSEDNNSYNGDNGLIEFEVGAGGNKIAVNVPGDKVFDVDLTGTSQLLVMMDNLKSALDSGDHQAVSNLIADVDKQLENVLAVRAEVGAKSNRVDLIKNRLQDDNYNFTVLLSKNEDADLAQVITNLKMDENVYRASLAAGARIMQPSLIDFLG